MMMNSPGVSSHLLCTPTVLIIILLHLLLSPALCLLDHHQQQQQHYPSHSTQGLLFEGKARLGSTPPSCHNKCNQCHPCMAVQVPTLPSHDHRVQPQPGLIISEEQEEEEEASSSSSTTRPMNFFDSSSPSSASNNRYSNYKPLGWKCRCGTHFYNP